MVLSILRRFKRQRQNERAATGTALSQDVILSHDNTAIGSWIQSMQGVTISGNVHGSMFSNNHLTIISSPNANNDQDYIEFKVRDIILRPGEIHIRHIDQDLQSDGTRVSTGEIHELNVEVVHSPRQFKIWRYERSAIESHWKKDLDAFRAVKHQNIIQLYGFCRSPILTALVFHDFQRSTWSEDYHLTLSGMPFVTYWADRIKEFEARAVYL
ncbi:hypothetical protein C8J56DRAFT_1060882 [Mycena floridula]|nr:hypothetical protein C8J56DRAFT_1060882 [Mycena floridula]